MNPAEAAARRRGREAALQMLYQTEIGRSGVIETVHSYWDANDPDRAVADEVRAFANSLVRDTLERRDEIDGKLAARAHNWRIERMAVIDRIVLRLAICELLTHPATPPRVVINEALELARLFSGEEAVPFVNGLLDAVRKDLDTGAPPTEP